jgi:hypothetical protein
MVMNRFNRYLIKSRFGFYYQTDRSTLFALSQKPGYRFERHPNGNAYDYIVRPR